MTISLYVGNLNFQMNDEGLHKVFEPFGNVVSAKVILDRETGRSKGFGFVEMEEVVAKQAEASLNGSLIDGRPLRISPALPRKPREERSFVGNAKPSYASNQGYSAAPSYPTTPSYTEAPSLGEAPNYTQEDRKYNRKFERGSKSDRRRDYD